METTLRGGGGGGVSKGERNQHPYLPVVLSNLCVVSQSADHTTLHKIICVLVHCSLVRLRADKELRAANGTAAARESVSARTD